MEALKHIPVSLLVFPLVAAVYAAQSIPAVGIVLLITGSPFWTGTLINIGMVGLVVEPLLRRLIVRPEEIHGYSSGEGGMKFFWMLIPAVYVGWYGVAAYQDQAALEKIREEFAAINAKVAIPFDPDVHALVFEGGAAPIGHEYGLPTIYTNGRDIAPGYHSSSLLEREYCDDVRNDGFLGSISIRTFGYRDASRRDSLRPGGRLSDNFCLLKMPKAPEKPIVSVSKTVRKTKVYGLPVQLSKTIVTMPDGREFVLRGGAAAPLTKRPRPVLGCALNSGGPSWVCGGGFMRDTFTPLTSSDQKSGHDRGTLARALGLIKVSPESNEAIDTSEIRAKIQQTIDRQMDQDLAAFNKAVLDPAMDYSPSSMSFLLNRPARLSGLSDKLVEGIERASASDPSNIDQHRKVGATGATLARLYGAMPLDVQDKYADRMEALFERVDAAGDGRHWLYQEANLTKYRKPLPYKYAPPSLTAQ